MFISTIKNLTSYNRLKLIRFRLKYNLRRASCVGVVIQHLLQTITGIVTQQQQQTIKQVKEFFHSVGHRNSNILARVYSLTQNVGFI